MPKIINSGIRAVLSRIGPRRSEQLIAVLERNIGVGSGFDPDVSGETTPLRFAKSFSERPIVLLDVGANQGQYCQTVIEQMGDTPFKCHCFEPSKATFEILTARHGNDRRVLVNQFALGSESKDATLYMDREGSGLASLSQRDIGHYGIDHTAMEEVVQVSTLDQYCESHSIDRIDLLKIDVEGWEMQVLEGAKGIFDRNSVQLVQFEFGGANIDTRTFVRDFYLFFQRRQMRLYRLIPGHRLFSLRHYSEQCERFRCSNLLAVKEDLVQSLEKQFPIE